MFHISSELRIGFVYSSVFMLTPFLALGNVLVLSFLWLIGGISAPLVKIARKKVVTLVIRGLRKMAEVPRWELDEQLLSQS